MRKSRYTQAELDAIFSDVLRVWQTRFDKIGATPEAQLLWLGDFIRRDLSDDANRRDAADALMGFLMAHPAASANALAHADILLSVDHDAVPDIQQAMREVVDGLRLSEEREAFPVWFRQPINDGMVWTARGVELVTRQQGVPQALAAVTHLLGEVGAKLRRCQTPTCQKLFAAKRPGQLYCTDKCNGPARVAKWRHANLEQRKKTRRKLYARRVREQHPHARIAQRGATKKERKG